MKISASLFLASIGSTSAFVAPAAELKCSSLRMSDPNQWDDKWGGPATQTTGTDVPTTPTGPIKSESIPFMTVNACMDGSMAGDVGFDPLGFADSKENLMNYREAEVKHARLAMLAAAGWPLSELWDKTLADMFGMEAVLDANNRVPSVLNGGLGKISPLYWVSCLALTGAIEVIAMFSVSKQKGYFPGNFSFDPLGLYPKDQKGQKWMRTAEIKNGRLAMLAITGFAFQEFATGVSVVDQYPIFFKPITEILFNSVPTYSIPDEVVQEAATAAFSSVGELSSAASEAPVFVPEALPAVTAEAATAAASESVNVAPPVVDIAPPVVDIVPPAVDAIPAAPMEAAAVVPPADAAPAPSVEELAAAKARIAELEAKLAAVQSLAR